MTPQTFFSIVSWIITGAIAGYIASLLLGAQRNGCLINMGLGIAGAFVGAFLIRMLFPGLLNLFGEGPVAGFINGIFHALFGALILLVIAELVLPGRQLGMRRRERRRDDRDY